MLTKRNALLAAGVAALVAIAGDRVASASDWNWYSTENGNVPEDGIRGGTDSDGSPLYFCRVWASVGYQPGKVSDQLGTCNYPYGGKELTSAQYEVMVTHWEWTSDGQLTQYPYQGGIDSDGAPLYICRAHYNGGLQPGKLKQGAGCYIGYGGNEILLNKYAVLQDDLPMKLLYPPRFDIGQIIGGQDAPVARALGLCVAFYYDSSRLTLQPGKWIGDDGMCRYSYAGVEVPTNDFAYIIPYYTDIVLGTPRFDFVVGQDTNGDPLYACTTPIANDDYKSTQVGKYRRDFDGECHVSLGRSEIVGNAAPELVD